uniref:protein-serine/threonine phosphatase n=1 Tax=Latimeria chalumnae TaxID=7897 RepID=H3B3F1_LATCH
MGAYLSQPNTVKSSFDGGSQKLGFGFSAMQGWRVSMEDAHNCIPELDSETAMFAVYDGHGGEEVALYCAKYLPEIIKEQKAYKEGKLQKALENAFLAIDGKLTTEEVIKELAQISGRAHEDEDEKVKVADEDDVDNEEAALLHEEATMTIEELLTRYGQNLNCAKALKSKGSVPRQPPAEEAREEGEKKKTEKDLNGELECRDAGGDHKKDSKSGKAEEEVVAAAATGISSSSDGAAAGGSAGGSARSTGDAGPSCSSSTGKAQRATKSKFFEDSEDESEEAEEEDDDDSEECSEEDEEGEGDYSSEDDDEEEEEDEEGDDGDAEEEDDMMLPGMDGKEESNSPFLEQKKTPPKNSGGEKILNFPLFQTFCASFDITLVQVLSCFIILKSLSKCGVKILFLSGDHFYKRNKSLPPEEQMICAMPDVKVLPLNNDHEFMVIACDGIWSLLSCHATGEFMEKKTKQNLFFHPTCFFFAWDFQLLDHCLAPDTSGDGTGCDNMTCIIVSFRGRQEQKAQPEASCKRKLEEVVQAEENGGDSVKKAKAE